MVQHNTLIFTWIDEDKDMRNSDSRSKWDSYICVRKLRRHVAHAYKDEGMVSMDRL